MNQSVLCQTIECIKRKQQATLLHKGSFELHCYRCVNNDVRNPYYEITDVSQSCKQQLTNAANNIQSNKTELKKKISNYFQEITKKIKEIEWKIYSIIEQFKLPSDCDSYLRGQDNDIHTLSKMIQNYFQPSNENDQDNGISFKEAFKNQLVIPKRIQQNLQKLNKMLSDFVKEIQDDNSQIIETTIIYRPPPSPDPIGPISKPTINIMNQQNAEGVQTKNFSFVLKSKQTFNLKGLQFGEGSDNEQISIIIKDGEGQEILNEEKIIGGRNMQIIFTKQIKFQENKQYTIQIFNKFPINLMIYKVKQLNDYVEVLSDSTPIDALSI